MRARGLTFILLVAAVAGNAFGGASMEGEGVGWWLFDVDAPAGPISIDITVPTDADQLVVLSAEFSNEGVLRHTGWAIVGDNGVDIIVENPALPEKVVALEARTRTGPALRTGVLFPEGGQGVVLLAVFGDAYEWRIDAPYATLRATSADVTYWNAGDLSGGTALDARAGAAATAGAFVARGQSASYEVSGRLVGGFLPWPTISGYAWTGEASLSGPAGEEQCPCTLRALTDPARGRGTYTLTLDAAGVMSATRPVAAFVDIPFP